MDALSLARRIIAPFTGAPTSPESTRTPPTAFSFSTAPGSLAGKKLQGASVVDVAPTLLYLMGLPLGRDMDGSLLTDVLDDELKKSQPVTFISSYRNFLIESHPEDWLLENSPLDALPGLLESAE